MKAICSVCHSYKHLVSIEIKYVAVSLCLHLTLCSVQVRAFAALVGYWTCSSASELTHDTVRFVAQHEPQHSALLHWALSRCAVLPANASDAKRTVFDVTDATWLSFWQQHMQQQQQNRHSEKCVVPEWCYALPSDLARNVIAGMQLAAHSDTTSTTTPTTHCIRVTSHRARDQLLRLLLHAAYAASFTADGDAWLVTYSDSDDDATTVIDAQRDVVRTVSAYTGRTWCFDMNDGFVVVRRATRVVSNDTANDKSKWIVTHASMPTIQGNWYLCCCICCPC